MDFEGNKRGGGAARAIFQLTSSKVLWRTDGEIPAEGLAAEAADPAGVAAGAGD